MRTAVTLTLNTLSTAWRISTLLASGRHLERHRVQLFLLLHALLGHERPDQHVAGVPHDPSASCRATSAPPARTTTCACVQQLVHGHVIGASRPCSHGTLRAARSSVVAPASDARAAWAPPPTPAGRARPPASWSCRRQAMRSTTAQLIRRDRRRQRPPAARSRRICRRHGLVVAARRGTERLAAALPLGGADGALAGAAGALLLPGLAAAARAPRCALGVVGARATVGQLAHHRLMQQRHLHRAAEHVGGSSSVPAGLALPRRERVRSACYFFSCAFCCCALVCFTLLRTITKPRRWRRAPRRAAG